MKEFLRGVHRLITRIVMCVPFHAVRLAYIRIFIGHLGKNVAISRNVELRNLKHIYIGDCSVINTRCLLDARGGRLIIGNNVDIAQDAYLWTLSHDYNNQHKGIGADTIIDDYVWVGARANILPGVHIKKGGVIATCAVVTKDVEENTVVAGVPAKVISRRKDLTCDYSLFHRLWFD